MMRREAQRATAPAPAEEAQTQSSRKVDSLAADVEENKKRLRRLALQNAHLAHRLQRIENSQIFRFLRWFGNHLLDLPPWILRIFPLRRLISPGANLSYKDWIQETAMVDLAGCAQTSPSPPLPFSPLVSVFVWTRDAGDESASLAAIRAQSYSSREVYFCSEDSVESFHEALSKATGEFTALVSGNTALEPDALRRWLSAAASGAALVYSDWDHMDSQGVRHSPRFTPEFSPTLLRECLYWGGCFLVRTDILRKIDMRTLDGTAAMVHEIALQSSAQGEVLRVPQVLWHQTGGEDLIRAREPFGAIPGRPYTASIVICSRSPERIRRSLAALQPVLRENTEVIVVMHENESNGGMRKIAAELGATIVPYRGAFHFGIMNGLGADVAKGSLLFFLNDDVYPMAPDWMERMAQRALTSDIGVVGSLLYYPGGKIQHAGVVVGGMPGATHVGRMSREAPYWPWLTMSREVSAVTGACMAMRREIWDQLGGFDPRFPVNYNDVDLCLRAQQAGYRVILEAGATLMHEESQTRPPGVRPEELALFANVWGDVIEKWDPYFHPNLALAGRDVVLQSPWSRL